MSNLAETFSKLFNPKAVETNHGIYQVKQKPVYEIILEEKENSEKPDCLQKLTLRGFDAVYFALKFDACKFLHKNKDESLLIAEDIRKACDYIVWARFQNKDLVLLIELKSKNNENVPAKFKSSKSFLSYLNTMLQEFYNVGTTSSFLPIPLLINRKSYKKITPPELNGFYSKGIGEREIYEITKDFEEILERTTSKE